MHETTYHVSGMTCAHCAAAVTREVSEVRGVSGVVVDVTAGVMQVSGSEVSDEEVRAAVDEAGYVLR